MTNIKEMTDQEAWEIARKVLSKVILHAFPTDEVYENKIERLKIVVNVLDKRLKNVDND